MIYPWQVSQWQLLHNAIDQHRLSHAYLLSGVPGVGKTNFARALSTVLLCERKTVRAACGHCRSCQWMRAETHPDFLLIRPFEKSHSIKIDQIRAFSEKINQTAHCGGYHAVIISPADAMPIAAANALLKTLEEPTGKVVMFLIDDQQHLLPTTIVSRCQKIVFGSDQHEKKLTWLKDKYPDEKNLELLLKCCGNAPLKVQHYLDQHYLALRDQITHHLENIIVQHANPIAPVTHWLKYEREYLLQICLLFCVDLLRVQLGVSSEYIINDDLMPVFNKIKASVSVTSLQLFLDHLNEKKILLSRGMNLNAQLLLEDIFITWEGVT